MRWLSAQSWQRDQFSLILAIFVTLLGFNFVNPFLPLYMQHLGVTDPGQAAWWAGLALGVAPLFTAISAPFWGALADRYGYKLMLQRSLLLFILVTVLMGLARHPWQVLALRATHGLLGGFGALSMTLVTITAPRERLNEAISLVQSVRILGRALGPILGGLLADGLGIRHSFFVTAGMCALAFVMITWGHQVNMVSDNIISSTAPERQQPWYVLLGVSGFGILFCLLFLIFSLGHSLGPVLPLYVLALGVPAQAAASVAGLAIGLSDGANALAALAIGRWRGEFSLQMLLLVTLIGGALASLLLAVTMAVGSLVVLLVLLGMTSGAALTLAYIIGALIIPERSRGAGIGSMTSATTLGTASGPLLGGSIAAINLHGVFLVNCGLFLVAALGAFRLSRVVTLPGTGLTEKRQDGYF